MAKFNVVQKARRTAIAEMKRAKHGDPVTRKLKQKDNPAFPIHSVSGKRKRKLFKKWRRDQKDLLAKGLITMEDVEMAVADGQNQEGTSKDAAKSPMKFPMKKAAKIKSKHSKKRDSKKKTKSGGARIAEPSSSAAMEE